MSENPFAGQGAVLLDIGGDVGALVVVMPSSMVGAEVEIDVVGGARHEHDHGHDHGHGHGHGHAQRAHVAVVERPVSEGSQPSLVFPELLEGSYELFAKGADDVLLTAEITGGQVTFLEWPEA
jgi:hypothetical protein